MHNHFKIKYFTFTLLLLITSTMAQSFADPEFLLEGNSVEDICDDGENVWFATNGNGIYKYELNSGRIENYSSANGDLANDFVYCITADEEYVWAGSIDGLFILSKRTDRWSKRKFALGGQLSNWIRSVAYDKFANAVWIGRFQYLTKFDISKRRFYDYDLTQNKNQKTNTIKTVAVDGDSLVWFGTEGGLHKYDKSRDVDDQNALIFYDNRLNYFNGEGEQVSISDILFDQNMMWIGLDEFITEERPDYNVGGLYRFDRRNEWLKFDTNSGLDGNGIFCIERTGNWIWVSMYQFGKRSKEPFGRGLVLINRFTNEIKEINGENLPDTILSMHFDGINMWLGHKSGVVKINLVNELANWNYGK